MLPRFYFYRERGESETGRVRRQNVGQNANKLRRVPSDERKEGGSRDLGYDRSRLCRGRRKTQSRLWCTNTGIDPAASALLGARRPSQTEPCPTAARSPTNQPGGPQIHARAEVSQRARERKIETPRREVDGVAGRNSLEKEGKTKARTRRWHPPCSLCIDVAVLARVVVGRESVRGAAEE